MGFLGKRRFKAHKENESDEIFIQAEKVLYGSPFPFDPQVMLDSLDRIYELTVPHIIRRIYADLMQTTEGNEIIHSLELMQWEITPHVGDHYAAELPAYGLLFLKMLADQAVTKGDRIAIKSHITSRNLPEMMHHFPTPVDFWAQISQYRDGLKAIDPICVYGIDRIGNMLLTHDQYIVLYTGAFTILSQTNPGCVRAISMAKAQGRIPATLVGIC